MAIALVIAFSGTQNSGAGEPATSLATVTAAPEKCPAGSKPAGAGCIDVKPVFIENCPGVRKALRFYTKRWQHWTSLRTGAGSLGSESKQGLGLSRSSVSPRLAACPRYLLHIRKAKARAAHEAWNRWYSDNYHWWKWMDDKHQRVGACETGYGKRPGNFHWDSGTYVSYAGIIRGGYAQFAHALGLRSWDETRSELGRDPTPREQVRVATALQARYGWGAWGCGGA